MKLIKYCLPAVYLFTAPLFAHIEPSIDSNKEKKQIFLPSQHMVRGNNKFALELYAQVGKKNENVLISPYSVYSALALAYMGSERSTLHQMSHVVHYPPNKGLVDLGLLDLNKRLFTELAAEEEPIHLKIVNSLFVQEGTTPHREYLTKRIHFWNHPIQYVPFQQDPEGCASLINQFVEENTLGLIKDLMPKESIDQMTRMVLVNALYLRAPWKSGFDPKLTYNDLFYGIKESVQYADYMQKTENLYTVETDLCRLVSLPFKEAISSNANLSLVVVVPNETASFDEVENFILSSEGGRWWTEGQKERVHLVLPKFEMTFSTSLKDPLITMGLTHPFDAKHGFPWGQEKLVIQDVVHKATITVDEGGILAAAATGMSMGLTSYEPPKDFIVNKPFLYLVVDKSSHAILFMGRVMNME